MEVYPGRPFTFWFALVSLAMLVSGVAWLGLPMDSLAAAKGASLLPAAGNEAIASEPFARGEVTPEWLTKKAYRRVEKGMTYEEVTRMTGLKGEVLSEGGIVGSEYHTVIVKYPGRGSDGANAVFSFQGGVVVSKSQYGINID